MADPHSSPSQQEFKSAADEVTRPAETIDPPTRPDGPPKGPPRGPDGPDLVAMHTWAGRYNDYVNQGAKPPSDPAEPSKTDKEKLEEREAMIEARVNAMEKGNDSAHGLPEQGDRKMTLEEREAMIEERVNAMERERAAQRGLTEPDRSR